MSNDFISTGWGYKDNGSSSSDKLDYVKLNEGITKIRILDDEPVMYWSHWSQADQSGLKCPGLSSGCPICELRKKQKEQGLKYTFGASRKIVIRVWNYNTEKVELLEKGVEFFDEIIMLKADLEENGVPLQDGVIKIRRTGKSKDDTAYRLDIDSKSPMPENIYNALLNAPQIADQIKPHTKEFIQRVLDGESMKSIYESMKDNKQEDTEEEVVLA